MPCKVIPGVQDRGRNTGRFCFMEWKLIANTGFEISDTGKVKNKHGKILRSCFRKGYEYITIGGVRYSIHRLVALAFIPNPDGKPEIDHINAIRTDNRAGNLRWVTRKENQQNPISRNNKSIVKRGKLCYWFGKQSVTRKAVCQFTKDNVFVARFDCMMDATKETGIDTGSISMCCNKKRKSAGGYKWEFAL